MSSIKLTADSGGGTFEIKAPSSSANTRVLTLPDTGNLTLGKTGILQVVQTVKTDVFTSTSTSYTDVTGMSVSITPSSSSNKVLVLVNFNCSININNRWSIYQLVRGSTPIFIGDTSESRSVGSVGHVNVAGSGSGNAVHNQNISFLDSPATTSATTYKIQGKVQSGATFKINLSDNDTDADYGLRTASSITVMEIAV